MSVRAAAENTLAFIVLYALLLFTAIATVGYVIILSLQFLLGKRP